MFFGDYLIFYPNNDCNSLTLLGEIYNVIFISSTLFLIPIGLYSFFNSQNISYENQLCTIIGSLGLLLFNVPFIISLMTPSIISNGSCQPVEITVYGEFYFFVFSFAYMIGNLYGVFHLFYKLTEYVSKRIN